MRTFTQVRKAAQIVRLPFIASRKAIFCSGASRSFSDEKACQGHKRLLLVYHSRTGLARQMADALETGARSVAEEMGIPPGMFSIVCKRASEATAADVLQAEGYLFCAPENLASISGEMKEFFDRSYYSCFESLGTPGDARYTEVPLTLGRPFGLAIAAGSDGTGAARQIERICGGWRLQTVADTLIVRNGLTQTKENILAEKTLSEEAEARCKELGGLLAATLLL